MVLYILGHKQYSSWQKSGGFSRKNAIPLASITTSFYKALPALFNAVIYWAAFIQVLFTPTEAAAVSAFMLFI